MATQQQQNVLLTQAERMGLTGTPAVAQPGSTVARAAASPEQLAARDNLRAAINNGAPPEVVRAATDAFRAVSRTPMAPATVLPATRRGGGGMDALVSRYQQMPQFAGWSPGQVAAHIAQKRGLFMQRARELHRVDPAAAARLYPNINFGGQTVPPRAGLAPQVTPAAVSPTPPRAGLAPQVTPAAVSPAPVIPSLPSTQQVIPLQRLDASTRPVPLAAASGQVQTASRTAAALAAQTSPAVNSRAPVPAVAAQPVLAPGAQIAPQKQTLSDAQRFTQGLQQKFNSPTR